MYKVIILPRVLKFIQGLERSLKNRLFSAMKALEAEPRPPGCIKVKSEDGVWRIRVSDYRIGYTIDDTAQIITIVRIGNRRDFYE